MYNKPLKNYEAVKIPYRSQQNVSNLHSCKPSIHHSAPVCTQANKSLGIIQLGPESDLQYIIAPELHSNLHKRLFLFQITKSKAVLISFQSRECEEWLNECYNSTYYRLESITEEDRGKKRHTWHSMSGSHKFKSRSTCLSKPLYIKPNKTRCWLCKGT